MGTAREPETHGSGSDSPAIRRRLGLTPRGRVLLLLLHLTLGAAWLSGDDHARLAAAMLAAPILVDLLAKLLARPDVAMLVRARRTQARSSFLESVDIENRSSRIAVRDLLVVEPRTHIFDAGGAYVPFVAPGRRLRARLAARSPRRGRTIVRTFRATTDWPLGMFRWTLTVSRDAELLSEPARTSLPQEVVRALTEGPVDPSTGQRESDAEFHSLREYRYGEDARHVHGRRSASLGTLVTKVLRGRPAPDCALVLDLRRAPGVPTTATVDAALELHISRAATLCDEFTARGIGFRVVAIHEELLAWELSGGEAALEFLGWLATARSTQWRALRSEELDALPEAVHCFWLPAGGYHDSQASRRTTSRLIDEEAS